MATGTSYHNPHFHVDSLVVVKIPPNMDSHRRRSVAWIDGIPVNVLHPRLVRPFSCIYKICEMYSNPYMTMFTLYHIPHIPGDGVAICRSCKNWSTCLGWYMMYHELQSYI